MITPEPDPTATWASEWLDAVAAGTAAMSQRKLSSILKRGGGLPAVRSLARDRGIHLLLLTDDQGDRLVAASQHPFKVLC